MPYIAPTASNADFAFGEGPVYFPPLGTQANFNLADGNAGVITRVPDLIHTVSSSWVGVPGVTDRHSIQRFKDAPSKGLTRRLNASQSSVVIANALRTPFADAGQRNRTASVDWGDSQSKSLTTRLRHENAKIRDIEQTQVSWENAGVITDFERTAPFLVLTPFKDADVRSGFDSVSLYSARRVGADYLVYPLPTYPQYTANIDLNIFARGRPGDIHLIRTRNNVAVQPTDSAPVFRWGDGVRTDRSSTVPWGPAGARDTTLDFSYDDYVGPIGPIDEETVLIPTRRIYIVANSAQIVRVSDGRDIPAGQVTLSTRSDTFTWDMSAQLSKKNALALVEGTDGSPVEVDVIINGLTWRLLVDGWKNTRQFNGTRASIFGRSRSAYLAAPYALERDYIEGSTVNARQLAEQELPPGWTLTWEPDDWTVPAGAWRYSGLSPIAAIRNVAAAAGGYVQTDRTLNELHIRSRYPAAPWSWSGEIPDFQIPHAVIVQVESDKRPGIGVNGVFVHGGNAGGIFRHVIRTGTAGDVLAKTIVNSLVTDPNPARALGIGAIAESRRIAIESHELPLASALGGLIEPGALIEIGQEVSSVFTGDYKALVRGVTVTAAASKTANNGTALSVRQRIDVERHYEDVTP